MNWQKLWKISVRLADDTALCVTTKPICPFWWVYFTYVLQKLPLTVVSFHLYPDDQLLPLVQAKYSQPVTETVINRHTYISKCARMRAHTHKYIHTYIHRYLYTVYCKHIILVWKVENSKCLQYWQFACNSMLHFSRNFNNIQENLLKTICHSLFVSTCSEVYYTKPPLTTLLQYIFV
jgi:hypothetical protein